MTASLTAPHWYTCDHAAPWTLCTDHQPHRCLLTAANSQLPEGRTHRVQSYQSTGQIGLFVFHCEILTGWWKKSKTWDRAHKQVTITEGTRWGGGCTSFFWGSNLFEHVNVSKFTKHCKTPQSLTACPSLWKLHGLTACLPLPLEVPQPAPSPLEALHPSHTYGKSGNVCYAGYRQTWVASGRRLPGVSYASSCVHTCAVNECVVETDIPGHPMPSIQVMSAFTERQAIRSLQEWSLPCDAC